jgi:drug/metabolite transporter (DMT)-like permease
VKRTPARTPDAGTGLVTRSVPVVFVLLWSTGFVGAKFGLPYAEPFTLLAIRMGFSTALLALLVWALRTPRLTSGAQVRRSAVIGALLHGCYLGGVFFAIDNGLPAGVSAVVIGLQPILVAIIAVPMLRERLTLVQLVGLVVSLSGLAMVLAPGLNEASGADRITGIGLISIVVALMATTTGTLIQKRHGAGIPLLSGMTVQYLASGVLFVAAAALTEEWRVEWTTPFIAVLAWQVLALSIGAVLLLYVLLRRGTAARVSSLYYLVPPATAIQAFFLFGEQLAPLSIIGIIVTASGVSLVLRVTSVRPTAVQA